ncbi:MAG: DEAD/DEAH box helicase [Bacteroidetes bacterium]|nr:DEAD/DEAH box helicase [Bacteroidota bacterium]
MPFSKFGLADQLVQGILATGYTAPTAIQSRAIPLAVAGKDIIGCAQTGTGKTAAFVLPMLNKFLKNTAHQKSHHTRGLVLTPTRELAQQVEEFVTGYGRFAPLKSIAVFGGVNMESQIKRLRRGMDIIVATPGRLIDHINRRTVDLSHVEILVIDEADRMFDMGFIQDVRKIIGFIPKKRQTLLFSATMSKEVKDLVASVQTNPEMIEIGERRKPVETVKQHFYSASQEIKTDLLLHILKAKELDCVLVFSRTKHGADKISRKLEHSGIKAVAIHSNRTQAQRQRALAGFKQGQFRVMVATDIAARGIDVEGISHVVNFDTPTFAEDYIHRIGRTGRASATGDAITFVSNQELKYLKSIERYTGKKFELKRYPDFDYTKKAAVSEKHAEPESFENRRSKGRGRREERHEHRRPSSGRQQHDRRHTESSGKPYREQRHKDIPEKSKREHRHTDTSGKPYHERRHKDFSEKTRGEQRNRNYSEKSHSDKRYRDTSGKSRHEFSSHERRDDAARRPIQGSDRSQFIKKQEPAQSAPPPPKNDWRALVAEIESGSKLKKKLKKLFIREKV